MLITKRRKEVIILSTNNLDIVKDLCKDVFSGKPYNIVSCVEIVLKSKGHMEVTDCRFFDMKDFGPICCIMNLDKNDCRVYIPKDVKVNSVLAEIAKGFILEESFKYAIECGIKLLGEVIDIEIVEFNIFDI